MVATYDPRFGVIGDGVAAHIDVQRAGPFLHASTPLTSEEAAAVLVALAAYMASLPPEDEKESDDEDEEAP